MNTVVAWLQAAITWFETVFAEIPLPLLEVWGRVSYFLGFVVALCAFGGFTFRPGGRWGFGRERQAWDAKALLSMPLTFVAIIASGYIGSSIVLVPGAQTFESLKDLVVFLCIVLFGYPALLTVPFAYGLSDLIEGVPPGFLLNWLPGYFINPTCFWVAYQLFGKDPDFRRARTWGRYLLFVLIFMSAEPVLWGYICSDKFPGGISYRSITPALFFTTTITWILAPFAMLVALPLARRLGLFWAEIAGHVRERLLGKPDWVWEAGQGGARRGSHASGNSLPIRMFIVTPFIVLVLALIGATAFVTMRSAQSDALKLATRLHDEISENINLSLDDYLAKPAASGETSRAGEISALLRNLPVAEHGRAFIIDRSGTMIASSIDANDAVVRTAIASLGQIPGAPAKLASETQFRFDHVTARPLSRETWLARATAYQDKRGGHGDWLVVTAMPESFYLAGVRTAGARSAMVFAVALLLSLTVAAVLASFVATPLRRISLATEELAQGNLALRLPGSRLEELDALTQSFNNMAAQLKKSFGDLLTEVEARKARERELQESETRLRASENRLQLATRAARLGIWDWDVRRDQLIWDDSMYQLYGVRREEFGGAYEAWSKCVVPEDFERASSDVAAALRGDREFSSEFRVRWPDGSLRVIRGAGQTIRDEDGHPSRMVGINWDVTDQLTAERELRQHRDNLEAIVAERTAALSVAVGQAESANRAKSVFLANMSHEIRTPMNAILGFTQLLLRDPALTDQQREHLRIVDRNGDHLLSLINDVLEMSKIEANRVSLNTASFDPNRLVRDLESLFGSRAEAKGLTLTVHGSGSLPSSVVGDEGKLRQILINLLGNAVKFTERGGVTLRAGVVREDTSGWLLKYEVEDTGPGIAPEDMGRLFKYFEQTATGRSTTEGTGLGLAISREFARLMDGDVTVESRVNQGTVFRVEIPAARPDRAAPAAKPEHRNVARLAAGQPSCRVLAVDDLEDNRRLVREFLESTGFEVHEAINGAEAIEEFENWQPHCILMDLRMPVMDGIEAIREIRARPNGREVSIIAFSASVFMENREHMLRVGADDFLSKPYRDSELFERIRRLTRVQYVYRSDATATDIPAAITGVDRVALPAEIIVQLRRALEEADLDGFLLLVDRVAGHNEKLATEMKALAARFEYNRIVALLDSAENNRT